MIDIFGKKKLLSRVDSLEKELLSYKSQLQQWQRMHKELKDYEWFEIGAGNVVIAHDQRDEIKIFTAPHLFTKPRFD